MAPRDVKEGDVLDAIAEYDKLGQTAFLRRYDFGQSTRFRLVRRGKFYDSKAIG